jgi:hypothetical protein
MQFPLIVKKSVWSLVRRGPIGRAFNALCAFWGGLKSRYDKCESALVAQYGSGNSANDPVACPGSGQFCAFCDFCAFTIRAPGQTTGSDPIYRSLENSRKR